MTRTSRVVAWGAVAGSMALVVAAAPVTPATASASSRHLVLSPARHTDLDLGARGDSTGDVQLDTATIRERGRVAGTATNTCQVFSMTSRQQILQCRLDLVLADGQLVTEGTVIAGPSGGAYRLAVTGGTRAYARARGDVAVHPGASAIGVDLELRR